MFELARWLEHDGDSRRPEAVAEARAFHCDASGCTALVRGRIVAVARHAAALRDDCDKAAIIIVAVPAGRSCEGGPVMIAQERLRNEGAHAIYFKAGAIDIEAVAAGRGQRPWTVAAPARGGLLPSPEEPRITNRARNRSRETWAHERSGPRRGATHVADEDP